MFTFFADHIRQGGSEAASFPAYALRRAQSRLRLMEARADFFSASCVLAPGRHIYSGAIVMAVPALLRDNPRRIRSLLELRPELEAGELMLLGAMLEVSGLVTSAERKQLLQSR
jgi:hypothetical protein